MFYLEVTALGPKVIIHVPEVLPGSSPKVIALCGSDSPYGESKYKFSRIRPEVLTFYPEVKALGPKVIIHSARHIYNHWRQ